MMDVKKVLVLYVGGTIGMKKNHDSVYSPCKNALFEYLKTSRKIHDPELGKSLPKDLKPNQLIFRRNQDIILHEMHESDPLLDSSNMSTQDWIRIARDIDVNYSEFDGFVILHGTDTLAYTASALSFMLEALQKPVILTGSQIPIFEQHSDGKDNVLYSLILAGCYEIPEVAIFFWNKLLRGCRTSKISSTHLDAFDSPNYPHLAEVADNRIIVNDRWLARPKIRTLKVHTRLDPNVGLFTIYPTITPSVLRAVLQSPTRGLVIQSYGVGNVPSNRSDILQVLDEAVRAGVVIINVTQCSQGTVVANYETGKALEKLGVISGGDMRPEAALTKLSFVLGLPVLSYGDRVAMMRRSMRGEVTEVTNRLRERNGA